MIGQRGARRCGDIVQEPLGKVGGGRITEHEYNYMVVGEGGGGGVEEDWADYGS